MQSALVYLAIRSVRNSVVSRLRRLRQPRYLLVALAVLLYFGMLAMNRRPSGLLSIAPQYSLAAQLGAALLAFVVMGFGWVMPPGAALQFTQADVHFLFPAPVTRRALLGYKIARLLLGAAGSGVFFAAFFGPTRVLPALAFFLRTWSIMSVLALHEAGVSLYRTRARDSAPLRGRRRVLFVLAGVLLTATTAVVLARFAFAGGTEQAVLVLVVLALLAAHATWILRSDAAFEEEAALLIEKVQAAAKAPPGRADGGGAANRTTPFALAPKGPAETAILWKNWLMFRRTASGSLVGIATILGLLVVAFLVAGAFAGDRGNPMFILGFLLAAAAALIGPIMLRFDLRQDLANLALLKTWPTSGAAIIRGEVLAPAIVLSAAATIALAGTGFLGPAWLVPASSTFPGRAAFVLAASLASVAVIVTQLVIQNGIAVMFPAWIRTSPGPGAGIEHMGQMMVVMYGGLLALLVASLVPAALAAAIFFTVGGTMVPAAVFALVLLAESLAVTEILGRILDRTDIQDVATAE